MIKFKFILLLFSCSSITAFSQKIEVNFNNEILLLNTIGKQIIGSETNDERYKANKNYKATLKKLINNEASFNYQFDSLKTISILKVNNLKIYNWALPLTDGTYEYFAFIQLKLEDKTYKNVELIDKSESIKSPERKTLTTKNWYGALYYEIIYDKKIGNNYYTLLGWDGNNNLTNKKIIEILYISGNGVIKFGSPILKTKKRMERRMIFEYSKEVTMSLKYHPEEKKIVFDYLVPASSKLKGIYEYYGPALKRFDAFLIGKRRWEYEEDTDITLDRSIKDSFWNDPKEE